MGSRNLGHTFFTIPVKRVQEDGLDPAPELVALAYFKMKEHFEEIPDDIAKTVRLVNGRIINFDDLNHDLSCQN